MQTTMNRGSLFSSLDFVGAVVRSSPGECRALALPGGQPHSPYGMYAIEHPWRCGRRSVSLSPFGLYARPDVENDRLQEAADRILSDLRSLRTVGFAWAVRFDDQLLADRLMGSGIPFTTSITHVLDIRNGYESVFSGYSAAIRNHTRRAERNGVVVRVGMTPRDVYSYYEIHKRLAAQKGNYKVLHPVELFLELLKMPRDVLLLLAQVHDVTIGGGLFFRDRDSLLYWHGASDRNYSKLFPSCAVINHAVRLACAEGLTTVNFGASIGIHSLQQFKASWGAFPRQCWSFAWANPLWKALRKLREKL